MADELGRLAREKYLLLGTFRKNGDRVDTPVWAARDGGDLVIWTERAAGKVKRIRRDPRVEVTACDLRGRKTHGPSHTGTARVLDEDGTTRTRQAIARKYGLLGRITMFTSRLRGGSERTVGVAVSLDRVESGGGAQQAGQE
ncbi:PPOX class F420-dependent oxidoreductase [Qaidamihabitans albus]|uniref:PPOX class F420-dependent oxidoreductase n=1 Tax=Qaidamihabitans albus TaxID=2795733 RepID=UPI0018F17A47|nr:PPOX class F420-dependent oxidoreductase [Qaidamihabitans albus]